MEGERREFTRFAFKEDEVQVFSDDAILFGQLKDISKGGLSFGYTPISGEKMDTKSINILLKGTVQFNLYHLACRIIYDILSTEECRSFSGSERRQCGIKFFWLKENQNKKLNLFLNHYVVKAFDI